MTTVSKDIDLVHFKGSNSVIFSLPPFLVGKKFAKTATESWSVQSVYSRTSMTRTVMAHLPCLTRTSSRAPLIPYMILLWSNFCIYVFMLLFLFSFFSDRWSLKIENENNNTETVATGVPYKGLEPLEFSL